MKAKVLMLIAALAAVSSGLISCGDDYKDLMKKVEKREIVEDDGIPDGKAGDESMVGYYSTRYVWNHNMDFLQNLIDEGTAWPTDFENAGRSAEQYGYSPALRIVDGHTIHQVMEGATLGSVEQLEQIWEMEMPAIDKKTFTFTTYYGYTYTYTFTNFLGSEISSNDMWEGRYSMNGSTMLVNIDDNNHSRYSWTYSDGTIIVTKENGETETYYKVK